MIFKRDNTEHKRMYYSIFAVVEVCVLIVMYYFEMHWAILCLATCVVFIDAWSNFRCANRQKKYIREIQINEHGIQNILATNKVEYIELEKCLFSIREKAFEKEKTEIEIREKRLLKSRLIGRLHISNWSKIDEIKQSLITNGITQIKYRPEGYWSKYGTLTVDVVITGTAIVVGEVAEQAGDFKTASDLKSTFMPIQDLKESIKNNNES